MADVPVDSQLYPPSKALSALTPFEAYKGGQLPSYMVHPADSLDFPAMWQSYVPPGMARQPGADYNADQNDRAIARTQASESFLDRTKRLLGIGGAAPAPAITAFPVMRGVINGTLLPNYVPPSTPTLGHRLGLLPEATPPAPFSGVRG